MSLAESERTVDHNGLSIKDLLKLASLKAEKYEVEREATRKREEQQRFALQRVEADFRHIASLLASAEDEARRLKRGRDEMEAGVIGIIQSWREQEDAAQTRIDDVYGKISRRLDDLCDTRRSGLDMLGHLLFVCNLL